MSSARLRELGALLRAVTDRRSSARPTAAEARRRFLVAAGSDRPRPTGRARAWALAATACAALVVVVVTMTWHGPGATTFEVGEPPVTGRVGEWLAANDHPVPVRFSDGSTLELAPSTKLRVTATTPNGADVLIESGTVRAQVAHRSGATRWLVHAGPFEVRVTGTEFDTSWDPREEILRVVVRQGSVAVSGPQLPPERAVVAGEFLHVGARTHEMALGKGDGPSDAPTCAACEGPDAGAATQSPPNAQAPDGGDAPTAAAGSGAAAGQGGSGATRAAGEGGASHAPWQELARQRQYRDAWTSIERRGFEQELASASAAELLVLADVARFAGQPLRAKQALLELRQRFGASGQSAFLLGRLAADQLGATGEAVSWFETYLREEPNGPLAEQALGRILDIQRRGSPEAARATAERYLARYPNGAYAALARSLLEP